MATNRAGRPDQAVTMPSYEDEEGVSPLTRTPPSQKSAGGPFGETKPSGRSRTPWNANGYALPSLEIRSPPTPCTYSPIDSASPRSPKHRFSDSHSTIATCAPSSTPPSHSRFSSTSTTGGALTFSTTPTICSPELAPPYCLSPVQGQLHDRRRDEDLSSAAMKKEISTHSSAWSVSPGVISPSRSLNFCSSLQNKGDKPELHLLPLPDANFTRTHGRASSAPNPQAGTAVYIPNNTSQPIARGSNFEPQIPHPIMENTSIASYITNETSPPDFGRPKCMHGDDCDTGVVLRKAISHFFGRNKLCTRIIPDYVWVHYCRKHYQRCRYRNPHEYAKLQCGLVLAQIRRIRDWSNYIKETGGTEVVKDWTLAMRKREQDRLQDRSKKRRHNEAGGDDEHNPDGTLNSTAVPQWLRKKCRDGYSPKEIENIILEIQDEIIHTKLSAIPDIEILPNMSTDGAEKAKPMKRQTTNNNLPKRSGRFSATPQPGGWDHEGDNGLPLTQKRRRTRNQEGCFGAPPSRDASVLAPNVYTLGQLPYRPGLNWGTQGHERSMEEPYYHGDINNSLNSHGIGPLPAPTSQRLSHSLITTRQETSAPRPVRPTHQRSASDFPSRPRQDAFSYQVTGPLPQPYSGPDHVMPAYTQLTPPTPHGFQPMPTQGLHPPTQHGWGPPNHYWQPAERSRHARHQSTPNAGPSAPVPFSSGAYDQGHYTHADIPWHSQPQGANPEDPDSEWSSWRVRMRMPDLGDPVPGRANPLHGEKH
ncbi:putative orp1 like protein [Rosellinia necatrix]|uniref:Putative orp1 like protein n=1 Tax=Rosellinia necatrix TaxID=77044 RepID=A0A1S7UMQ8_ROSNE|nr:putative orp1 like protein [Rosellinia necatrix]